MGVLLLKLLRIGYFFVFFPSYYVGHKPCCKWTKPTYPIYRVCQLGPRLTDGREEMSTSAISAFFLLIYSGESIEVHFGLFTQPCHWLKRLHHVITWGNICFLVFLQCPQTICFSGWGRYWKSWCFFIMSTRCDIIFCGEHGKMVWHHIYWCSRKKVHNVASRAREVLGRKFTT